MKLRNLLLKGFHVMAQQKERKRERKKVRKRENTTNIVIKP